MEMLLDSNMEEKKQTKKHSIIPQGIPVLANLYYISY